MKTALITGGNKGIGFAIAKALGQKGWQVVLGVRSEINGKTAIAKLRTAGVTDAAFVILDLSQPETISQAVATIKNDFSDTQFLINNAGIPGDMMNPNLLVAEDNLRQTMEVNFFGTFQLSQMLLPVLEANDGRIINVTIPTEANPAWNPISYKASKAAQNVMMDSWAIDFDKNDSSMAIFSVHPGPTTTDLNGNTELPGFHTTDDVADKIVDVIVDGKSHNGEFIEIYPELKQ
ncbi:SDR family NAD(P)-dependent oxidoreductase [Lentilactobacillus kosonis]|uniref:Short-chain dehydrogenase/reductase SDR n=1 Tax=Lentilactobacillus kosonis TaxID=2810561 RepID=A0A401FHQ5_9LACO|nr:SDR family NAD(P)-dependent oxidoreductase [Lentilactobacillus kosonis]GAY71862.1 short-chain dehydrogenase/reductase SDR [Lentilactobacillus kosonis]